MEIFLIKAFQFLLSLSLIVVLHELGHFIPAKIFKTKVEKFYLFFDVKFSIFKKKIGDTIYGIGWLPLGGYVKIAGMIDESMDLDQMKKDPQPWEFRSKPAWQRLIIMLGGVTVNIILGFLIYMMILFIWGKDIMPYTDMPDGFNASPVAKSIGFRDGDVILEVDNKELELVVDINRYLFLRNSKKVKVKHTSGKIEVINIPLQEKPILGSSSVNNAKYILEVLTACAGHCMDNTNNILVTGPINKETISASGTDFSGHTEFLAEHAKIDSPLMLMANEKIKIGRLDSH